MHVCMMRALCLVDRLTSGKDDVGSPKQFTLPLDQLWRRAKKSRQLIHAVVYCHAGRWMRCKMRAEAERHWGVVPAIELGDSTLR